MENIKFPTVIKKRNGLMIGVSIIEIIIGIMFGITEGGIKSIPLWIFIFIGIISALTVLVEYNQDILLKENNMEFYKNNNLIKSIKFSSINSIYIGKGNEPRTKNKDFFTIGFGDNDNKNKTSRGENYLINPMNYSSVDLKMIKNIIVSKNSSAKVSEEVDKFIK